MTKGLVLAPPNPLNSVSCLLGLPQPSPSHPLERKKVSVTNSTLIGYCNRPFSDTKRQLWDGLWMNENGPPQGAPSILLRLPARRMVGAGPLLTAAGILELLFQLLLDLVYREARGALRRWKLLESAQEFGHRSLRRDKQIGAIEQPIVVCV